MSKPFDVCIRGDGVVGRTLALLLAQQGLRVALVGHSPSIALQDRSDDVRAYALNHASRQTLQTLRAWPESAHITPVCAMHVWGDDGGRIDFSGPAHATEGLPDAALAWIVDVPALEQVLAQAIRFQPQIDCVQADVSAPLTVVCEGRHSASRSEFGVEWIIKPYPQRAIAARLTNQLPHQGIARQWFIGGNIVALLPLQGDDAKQVALVWSVAQERADDLQNMSPEEFCGTLQAACGQALGTMALCSERASWSLVQATAQRWVGPGWALAGDAAHAVHPLAGQGLNLGLADVAALAKILAHREYWRGLGDERLLRRYERDRKAHLAAAATVSDGLHTLFAQIGGPWQTLRNWGMTRFGRSRALKDWAIQRASAV